MEMPPQEVCGKQIFTIRDADNNALRDMESMMYNPNVDKSNKEYDKATGKLAGMVGHCACHRLPACKTGKCF